MMTRYDAESDDIVPATQEWCDAMQRQQNLLAMQREIIRAVVGMNIVTHEDDIRQVWDFIRGLGIAATVAESIEERKRQREISKMISDGLNAELRR